MSKQQTAVEWLFNRLTMDLNIHQKAEAFEQAKQMEKEQIIEAAKWMPEPFENMEFLPELAKKYYNQTFKTENNGL